MDKIIASFFAVIFIGFGIFMLASVGGTMLYFIWPVVAPAFHLPELGWFQCVCLVWVTHILIPYGSSSSTSK